LLQNDTDKTWRTEPFEIINKGLVWNPPSSIDQITQKQSISFIYRGNFDVKNTEKVIKNELIMKEPTITSSKLTLLPREKMDELIDLLSQISLKRYIFL